MATVGLAALGGFSALSLHAVLQTVRWKQRRPPVGQYPPAAQQPPRACIVLTLKGLDPFLDECLERLGRQDYPAYSVLIVVDSEADPAWGQAIEAQARFGAERVEVIARRHRLTTCTRKLASLSTAFEAIPRDVDVVALCDGDAVADPNWLRTLVEGLEAQNAMAVSGNRWYEPLQRGLPELSRQVWYAIALPSVFQFNILWAGSLAFRRELLDEPAFINGFQQAFSDDTFIAEYLESTGRAYCTLDRFFVINREATTWSAYWNFLVRQLLCVRMHHPGWRPILWHGIALAVAISLIPMAFLTSRADGLAALAGLVLLGVSLLLGVTLLDQHRRSTSPASPQERSPWSIVQLLSLVPSLLVTAVHYPAGILCAAFARQHVWRGVLYRFVDDRVVADREHLPSPQPALSPRGTSEQRRAA